METLPDPQHPTVGKVSSDCLALPNSQGPREILL